jgi:hypothetical protein
MFSTTSFEGIVNGDSVEIGATTAMANINNQIKFSKTWGGELSGFFERRVWMCVFKIQSMGMLNVGVTKQIIKGKWHTQTCSS